MRRFWAAATAVALCTAGVAVTGAQAGTAARGGPPSITWAACSEGSLKAQGAECGYLAVPLDYAKPDGAKIEIALSRIKSTVPADKRQGPILINPGGPGGAGRGMAVLGQHVPKQAGAAYDWIGFDPRGVGASKPKLTCDSKYTGYNRPPYVPSTPEIDKAWHARTTAYAAACAKAGGALLDHMRTDDTVRDIDRIREALGVEKISFYGFSYGSYLGQIYATRNPERVHRMVLDGVVDPTRVWYQSNLDQDIAFDKAIKVYFAWIAKYDSVYHLGRTAAEVERLYYRQLDELAEKPAGQIGPAELTDVFLQPGYYVFGWEETARAFSAWVKDKDPAPLKRIFDENHEQTEGADNGYAVYLAVQCTDAPWPVNWKKWARDNWRVHRKAPFETWGNAWYNAPCRHWAADPGTPIEVDGSKAPPILLINETLDAATPYSGALETRRRFPRSVLLEGVGGTTHAGSLFGNACVDNTIADYLADGTLPGRVKADRSDKQCEPIAKPTPLAKHSLGERLRLVPPLRP
ncbi:alpha/beta hydrolase [Actinoplanes sichuanensis]|uniref:Alpha/beta hydrolase n=1 Tax=Actinoplanes sichuanensis TaxID=512349 RepID=A0ABW4AVN6_9ACTN|nr:alpha/beta hydrolase [Actinoplanes sichuanensis]BEL10180.1 alpha/beta hydrolase [Actinoplanes sichuanensis]